MRSDSVFNGDGSRLVWVAVWGLVLILCAMARGGS